MGIGDFIYNLFGAWGEPGILLCIFLIFLLDAFLLPTLPELFIILAFMGGQKYGHPQLFGAELIAVAVLAELVGIFSLYYVVKRVRIPQRVQRIVHKYTNFLVLGDEKLLLLNRIAPMIPFAGAFIAISNWDPKKCAIYIVIGCVLKFGFILQLSNFFYGFFGSGKSEIYMIVMVLAVIAVSAAMSLLYRRKHGIDGTPPQA